MPGVIPSLILIMASQPVAIFPHPGLWAMLGDLGPSDGMRQGGVEPLKVRKLH